MGEFILEEYHKIIREEVNKIKETLKINYGIELEENKEIDYGIKYSCKNKSENNEGTITIYYRPKKSSFTFTPQGNSISTETLHIIEDTFQMRNSLNDFDGQKDSYTILKQYYEALKKYENEEFDFIDFAEELSKNCKDESVKNVILENRYNFSILEKIYLEIVS